MSEAALQCGSMRIAISDEAADSMYALVHLASDLGEAKSQVYAFRLGIASFLDQLGQLGRSLDGTAKLDAIKGDFSLVVMMAGQLGHIDVKARLATVDRDSEFVASGRADQSYLSDFMRALRTLKIDEGDA